MIFNWTDMMDCQEIQSPVGYVRKETIKSGHTRHVYVRIPKQYNFYVVFKIAMLKTMVIKQEKRQIAFFSYISNKILR